MKLSVKLSFDHKIKIPGALFTVNAYRSFSNEDLRPILISFLLYFTCSHKYQNFN